MSGDLLNLAIFFVTLLGAYVSGTIIERAHYKSIRTRERRWARLPAVSVRNLPENWEVVELFPPSRRFALIRPNKDEVLRPEELPEAGICSLRLETPEGEVFRIPIASWIRERVVQSFERPLELGLFADR